MSTDPKQVVRRAIRLATDPKELRRLLTLRCVHCGHKFRLMNDPRHSRGDGSGVYHGPCMSYIHWRSKAEERLWALGLTLDVAGVTDRDITGAAELRATTTDERVAAGNRAFRVFYDLSKEQA